MTIKEPSLFRKMMNLFLFGKLNRAILRAEDALKAGHKAEARRHADVANRLFSRLDAYDREFYSAQIKRLNSKSKTI